MKLEKGVRVNIYNCNISGNRFLEGSAVLIKLIIADKYSEYWKVRFENDNAIVNRFVSENDILPKLEKEKK